MQVRNPLARPISSDAPASLDRIGTVLRDLLPIAGVSGGKTPLWKKYNFAGVGVCAYVSICIGVLGELKRTANRGHVFFGTFSVPFGTQSLVSTGTKARSRQCLPDLKNIHRATDGC